MTADGSRTEITDRGDFAIRNQPFDIVAVAIGKFIESTGFLMMKTCRTDLATTPGRAHGLRPDAGSPA